MVTRAVLVFGIVGLVPVLAFLPWNDPCLISPKRLPKRGQVETIQFTRECPKSEIRWDYPQGTLQVHFAPLNKVPFRLCLKSGFANFIKEIYSVVDGRRIPVEAPTEGSDSCVSSNKDELLLVLVAPSTMYYMTEVQMYTSIS